VLYYQAERTIDSHLMDEFISDFDTLVDLAIRSMLRVSHEDFTVFHRDQLELPMRFGGADVWSNVLMVPDGFKWAVSRFQLQYEDCVTLLDQSLQNSCFTVSNHLKYVSQKTLMAPVWKHKAQTCYGKATRAYSR
jgi:hypothetical protein